jgi:hypothetical protein
LYASSGDLEQANKMIDDQPGSAYQFAAGDTSPTAVIDLGRERVLSRISAIYAAQPGSVDFYVLSNLPIDKPADASAADQSAIQQIANVAQSTGLPGSIKLSEAAFARLKAVGSDGRQQVRPRSDHKLDGMSERRSPL